MAGRQGGNGMFGKKRGQGIESFDREKEVPVIRSSICTGEQVAGFKDRSTGRFREVMCLRTDRDREEFLKTYGIRADEIRREW
ncbi:MAG: aspartate dehydrogenase [Clostridiales bacterium]|nr:MAG: aspartate dehydrogenase [Clostridiales bacterium]